MPKQLAKDDSYKTLVKKIQSELTELDFFIRRRTAEGYWRIGKFIDEHILEHKDKADYGTYVLSRLGEDVNRDKSLLARALKFYRIYPIVADRPQLSWDHYKRLITVQDEDRREKFEKLAVQKEWSAEELYEAIRLDRVNVEEPEIKPGNTAKKLTVTRARLYTYQILEPGYIHSAEEMLTINLGFNFLIHTEIKGLRLKAGDLIESVKLSDEEILNADSRKFNADLRRYQYSFKHSDAKPRELYTYKAFVERVVDADTIWLIIDLGFSSWSRQKVRLRGIDAPELSTKEGIKAKQFVEAKLKEVEFVVVKTYKSDKYDRYLTDVFYPPLEPRRVGSPEELRRACSTGQPDPFAVLESGTFLNQELLDLGLASYV